MTSRVQNSRSSVSLNRPAGRPVGEFYVNFADNQLGVIDPTPTARDLLAVRYHVATAGFSAGAVARVGASGLYQAKTTLTPHAFNPAEWDQFLTAPQGDGRWLPLAGGTLTGNLGVQGQIDATGPISTVGTLQGAAHIVAASGGGLGASATNSDYFMDSAGWVLRYTRANGRLSYIRGSDARELFAIDAGGNLTVAGQITAGNGIAGYLPLIGGNLSGGLSINGRLDLTGGIASQAEIIGLGGLFVIGGAQPFGLVIQGTTRRLVFAPDYRLDWDTLNGNLVWATVVGSLWNLRTADLLAFNGVGPVGGVGAFINISDERTKTDITPAPYGLSHVSQLEPIRFRRLAPDTRTPAARAELGFSAQQVAPIIPEAVVTAGFPEPDTLAIQIDGIVAALVGAVQELARRVTHLEVQPQ